MNSDLSFVAIDFETANSNYSSICQVGMVFFENGNIIKEESQLIDPEDDFDDLNIMIHQITPDQVKGKPKLCEYYPKLCEKIAGQVVVHHQPFDRIAFSQACDKYCLEFPVSNWLDNAAVVRRTWEEFRYRGYGLRNVADYLKIEFNHHDAREDAKAAGLIFIEACKKTGKTIEQWKVDVERKRIKTIRKNTRGQRISGDLLKADFDNVENTDNPFFMKKVVISGTYTNWPDRKDLAKILKNLGADIDSGVTDKTNILCSGKGVGPKKIEKMEKNIESGKDAVILNEEELIELLIDLSLNQE